MLASLEAEAVAWTDEQELRDVEKFGCAYLFTVNPITTNADPRRVIKLYTAPPAPVVPEEINVLQAANLVLMLGVLDNGIPTVAMKVWNACRASALDSLPQNADSRCSNSPVFPDGWVMVPVEPTEEMLAELCLVKGWTARALNARYQAMLAAAPKPEA